MFKAKINNGFNMARMGRFDIEHSHEDDRVIVYIKADDGSTLRAYISADGGTSTERVAGSTYDDQPGHYAPSTNEVDIGSEYYDYLLTHEWGDDCVSEYNFKCDIKDLSCCVGAGEDSPSDQVLSIIESLGIDFEPELGEIILITYKDGIQVINSADLRKGKS